MATHPSSSLNPQTPSFLTNSHLATSYPSTTGSATSTIPTNNPLLSQQGPGLLSRTPLFTTNSTSSQQQQRSATYSSSSNGPSLTGGQLTSIAGSRVEDVQRQQQQSGGFGGASASTTSTTSPWLSGAIQQGKVEIVNLIPDNRISINSLDIESRHLVCGSDGEALFVIPNLTLTWLSLFFFSLFSESLLFVIITFLLLLLWILLPVIHTCFWFLHCFIYVPGMILLFLHNTWYGSLKKIVFLVFCVNLWLCFWNEIKTLFIFLVFRRLSGWLVLVCGTRKSQ